MYKNYVVQKKQKGKTVIKRENFTLIVIFFLFLLYDLCCFVLLSFIFTRAIKNLVSLRYKPIYCSKAIHLTNTILVGLSFIIDSVNFRTNCL